MDPSPIKIVTEESQASPESPKFDPQNPWAHREKTPSPDSPAFTAYTSYAREPQSYTSPAFELQTSVKSEKDVAEDSPAWDPEYTGYGKEKDEEKKL